MSDYHTVNLHGPADIAALIPFLLGYHPQDRIVFLALRDGCLQFLGAKHLPDTDQRLHEFTAIGAALAAHDVDSVILVGYGNHEPVAAVIDVAVAAIMEHDIEVMDAYRVADGRLWHLRCTDPQCRYDGVPFDATTTAAAAHAVSHGYVALADRDAMAAQLAPVTGAERTAMTAAFNDAVDHLKQLQHDTGDDVAPLQAHADALIAAALTAADNGERLPDDQTAQLLLLLLHPAIRDISLDRIHGDRNHLAAWIDLLRRADSATAAEPGICLAIEALMAGNGSLAVLAVERVLQAEPDNQLAHLLHRAVGVGMSPDEVRRVFHGEQSSQ